MSVTSDGGRNWTTIDPTLTAAQFWTPLVVNPSDANDFLVGGRTIKERTLGYSSTNGWTQVFDLGTAPSGANRQASALDIVGPVGKSVAYAGFCGYCDVVTQGVPFDSGVATNAGGTWHIAAAAGLPKRYITSIRVDPGERPHRVRDPRRLRSPPGCRRVRKARTRRRSARATSSSRPTAARRSSTSRPACRTSPRTGSLVRNGQRVVATDIGVFISSNTSGGSYSVLGKNLPAAPVMKLRLQPGDPDNMIAVTFGRGVYAYRFESGRFHGRPCAVTDRGRRHDRRPCGRRGERRPVRRGRDLRVRRPVGLRQRVATRGRLVRRPGRRRPVPPAAAARRNLDRRGECDVEQPLR